MPTEPAFDAPAALPLAEDPVTSFQRMLEQAHQSEPSDATAVALATADTAGRPSVRMVLLKHVDERGFAFYTNLYSRKAQELADNPSAALCFHWPSLAWQVRVEGPVEAVEPAEADHYFASRNRGSQIGAWASRQSATLADPQELEERLRRVEERFAGGPVTRPPHWSGFRLRPRAIELWSGRENRLHERHRFERANDGDAWRRRRLYP